ncbi:GNAT family N-acetyltransferase [Halobium salinum]|uniref:GNAT family N-acetyltransferase n=1 Tax=Halobium salinum TaxID=1364940 RepID=A0ABD5PHY1_9EURY|nr:GNAT family N-acetyltransferase [Halobium salinum]
MSDTDADTSTNSGTDTTIVELTNEAGWLAAYPVLSELRPVDEATYLEYLRAMTAEGYRLFGLVEGGGAATGSESFAVDDSGAVPPPEAFVAVAGVRISTTLYHGKHAWVYDLVTRPERRSEGHGERLLSFVEAWATARDCAVVELASGLWREDAHRFYEGHVDYERYCYTFKKDLS